MTKATAKKPSASNCIANALLVGIGALLNATVKIAATTPTTF
jgi:hypothetical protein